MGLTQKLGTIPLAIQTDSSNNVGIGGAANASYKLQVTGDANVTGALSGTTADFQTTTGSRYLQIRDAGSSTPSLRSVNDTIGQLRAIAIEAYTISLRTGASSGLTTTEALAISATGAATFSSSATFGGNVTLGSLTSGGQGGINGASGTINRAIVNCPYPGASALTLGYYSSAYGLDIWVNGDGTGLAPAYIDQRNAEAIIFRRNTQGTAAESMRITGSGNVGIGTSSPSALLHVAGSAPYIHIQPTSGSRYIDIGNWDASTNFMEAGGGGLYIKTQQAYDLLFGTNTAERMRITNEVGTANVCIGTTSSPQANSGRGALTINGSSTTILTMAIGGAEKGYVYHNASEINLVNSTPGRLYCIAYTGGVYLNSGATSWTANSDERLKDITGNIDNAVDSLMSLRAVKHTWKADADKVEKLALIAQDVEKVFPQVIDKGKLPSKPDEEQTDETEYLGVRYTELIPVLVKAIQELSAKVTALENK